MWLSLLSNLINPIVEGLKALFFVSYGKKSEKLKQKEKELENVKKANKRKNDIDRLPANDIDDIV